MYKRQKFGSAIFDLFELYWHPDWKKYLRGQRLTERDVERKLGILYDLNKRVEESKIAFKRRFFREANEADFFLLMCRAICTQCANKNKKEIMVLFSEKSFDEKASVIEPVFAHWPENPTCEYCRKREANGLVFHVLEINTIFEILKKFFTGFSINALSNLQKIYKIYSNHFVHFSVSVGVSEETFMRKIGNREINVCGFDSVIFVLRNLSYVLCEYFIILKNKFNVDTNEVNHCKTRKNGFRKFVKEEMQ